MVIGTFCVTTEVEEVSFRTEEPLIKVDELKEALTPAGNPATDNCTAPKLKDFTWRGMDSTPLVMEYDGM